MPLRAEPPYAEPPGKHHCHPAAAMLDAKSEGAAMDLHATLARALEFGMQQAAQQIGFPTQSSLVIAGTANAQCSCHIGHYSNTQIIGNLLHLVVQLSLFPRLAAATADAALQVGEAMVVPPDVAGLSVSCQTAPGVAEVFTQCGSGAALQDLAVQASQSLGDKAVQTLQGMPTTTNVAQTDGLWLEYATKGVRIGGGYHLFSRPTERSLSPGRADCGRSPLGFEIPQGSPWEAFPPSSDTNASARSPSRGKQSMQGTQGVSFHGRGKNPGRHLEHRTLNTEHVAGNDHQFNSVPTTAAEGISQLEAYAAETTMLGKSVPSAVDMWAAQHTGRSLNLSLEQQEVADAGEWLDQQLGEGALPRPALPAGLAAGDAEGIYGHYVHGVPSAATSPNRYNVGAYSQGSQQHTLSRRDIADAVHQGRFDNVQLYRVLRPELSTGALPPDSSSYSSPAASPQVHQGKWRKQPRPASAPSTRRGR